MNNLYSLVFGPFNSLALLTILLFQMNAYCGTVTGAAGTITVGNSAQNGSSGTFDINQNTKNCGQNGKCAEFTDDELVAAQCMVNYANKYCESGLKECTSNPILKCSSNSLPDASNNNGGRSGEMKGAQPISPGNNNSPVTDNQDPGGSKSPADKAGGSSSGNPSGNNQQSSAACQQAAQQAGSTCSGGGGGYGSGSGGINSYANALAGATADAGRSNLQQGVACSNAINQCTQQCQSSDPGMASQCQSLGNRVQGMGQQAQSLNGANQGAANSGSQSAASNSAGTENCDLTPNTPECLALAESKKYAQGKVGFEGNDQSPENFNVGSATDGSTQSNGAFQGSGVGLDQIRQTATYGTIANNSGGSIPGQGSSSGSNNGGGRGGSPGAPGYTTDVLQGFQGASAQQGGASVGSTDVDAAGGFKGYGTAARAPSSTGLDLKRYLPGGSKAPPFRKPGGFIPFSIEINGPHVNIWSRVNDRYQEKCKLGELIDCR